MTPLALDNAQRWAAKLSPGDEIRTTTGPNGKAWKVESYDSSTNYLNITRTPGRRIQYKVLYGVTLVAAHKASTRPIGIKAPPRLKYNA